MSTSRPRSPNTADVAAAITAGLPKRPARVLRKPKQATRKATLSVAAVVEAAIEVLDEAGVAGLSMRRVADRLGTGAASLYAYVSGKDELVELVFDELVGRVPLPQPDPKRWREQLTQMLGDLYDVLASHRDAALAGLGRIPTTPRTITAAEAISAVMKAGGLSDYATALGIDLAILYVSGSAFEAGLYAQSGLSEDELERYFTEVHLFYDQLPADRFPVLAAIAPDMTGHDGEVRFEFGLDVIIAGLEAVSKREAKR